VVTILGEPGARGRGGADGSPTDAGAADAGAADAGAATAGATTGAELLGPVRRRAARPWPVALALTSGLAVAGLLLAGALQGEFPLFSEASAERGRDCTTIASARHALEATLGAHLPLQPADGDAAREVVSAVAAFDARTSDIATPAVADGLVDVRTRLDALADRVRAVSVPGAAPNTAAAVEDALASVRDAWKGPLGRVCS